MDALLTLVGVLATGALVIAACVFVGAARRYVTGDARSAEREALESDLSPYRRSWVERSQQDRRRFPAPAAFPMHLEGVRIEHDRRMNPDRRRAA